MIDLGILLTIEYAVLILVDVLTGHYVGLGIPGTWTGTILLLYEEEFLFWLILPIITMLWWRSWAHKHPQQLEEL